LTPAELITRKRDGHSLSRDEIAFVIRGFVDGSIPEYQMSALAMAIFFQGMEDEETAALTQEMLLSGVRLEWSAGPPVVDKHSTGGVGDKVSLVLAPLLAACGLRVPMISGRGLGPTGGTLDKLESISEMQNIVERVGCVITGATENLVPADRKLYSLRDVTATVPSIPLITASIMSKKLAESLNALVLDVKCGSGAFMKTRDQAVQLADSMVRAGKRMGVQTTALVTDMNQPLGRMCGNAVEVAETLDCLAGEGPDDLRYVTLALGAELLLSAGRCASQKEAETLLVDRLDSGAAREVFEQMIIAQGGDLKAGCRVAGEQFVLAERSGFVTKMDTEALGLAVIDLGGGRRRMGDSINHSVGLEMLARIGGEVSAGEPVARVFADRQVPAIISRISGAITIGNSQADWPEFIVEHVR
jgi:pyrimidine-nucleoside phosphorylase